MKYLLHLFLCVDGCVCRILGMGPRLDSMSPLSNSSKCKENAWIVRRFGRSLWVMYCCVLVLFIILLSRFVMWLGFCVCLIFVVLCWFLCFILFFWFWARPVGQARFRCFMWFGCCVFFCFGVFLGDSLGGLG